tara:strand:- start:35 stop:4120 length:4086 start_codon:yes stop_codon:yes gene_type:complete
MAVIDPFVKNIPTGSVTDPFVKEIEVDKFSNPTYNNNVDSNGYSIASQVDLNRKEIEKKSSGFWSSVSNSLVGEKAEFGEYWAKGLGQSNANLMSQYYFNKSIGQHWQKAFNTELQDTGIAERFVQTLGTITGDIPTFTIGAIPAALLPNPFTIGFSGAFFNEKIKEMYLEALKKGQVDTFEEWWEIFIDTGFKNAAKAGLQLGTTLAFPGLLGKIGLQPTGFFANTLTQQAAFEGMGRVLNGEFSNSDDLINNFLLFGAFNLGKIGQKKATKIAAEEGIDSATAVLRFNLDPTKVADTVSINLKKWRTEKFPSEKPEPLGAKDIDLMPETKLLLTQEGKFIEVSRFLDTKIEKLESTITSLDQTISGKVKKAITKSATKVNGWEAAKDNLTYFWFDQLLPIKKIVNQFYKADPNSKMNPYEMIRALPGEIASAAVWFEKGPSRFNEPGVSTGKGLNKILESIKTEKEYNQLIDYLIGKRVLELNKRGLEVPFDKTKAQNDVILWRDKYETISKELREYQKRQLDYLQDAGILDKATRKVIEEANKDYIPFRKLNEKDAAEFGQTPKSGKGRVTGLKKYKGFKEGDILDPIDSIYTNTPYYLMLAEKNAALTKFFEMVETNPVLAKELGIKNVTNKAKKIEISAKEVAENLGVPLKEIQKIGVEKFSVFRKDGHVLQENQISVYRNGKRQVWEIPKDLIEPFAGTNKITMIAQNALSQALLRAPTKILRAGVVLDPIYSVKNLGRDSWLTSIVSKHGFAIPFVRTFQGLGSIFWDKPAWERFQRSGALQSTFNSFNKYGEPGVKAEFQNRTLHNQIHKNPLNKFVEKLSSLSEVTEVAAKFGEFLYVEKKFNKLNLKKPGSWTNREILKKAGFESRDLFDFAKAGYAAESVNLFSAFYTSRLRGYEKMYEAFKDRPIKTLSSGLLWITAPSIYLWFENHDDPMHEQLPQWKKDLFWNIPINKNTTRKLYNEYLEIYGDSEEGKKLAMQRAMAETNQWFLSVPIPWEMGLLFGKLPERIMDHAFNSNPDVVNSFFLSNLKSIGVGLIPIPDIIRPFGEIMFNKSIYYDRPVVPPGIQNSLMPEYEYGRDTSQFSIAIGNALQDYKVGSLGSPAKIDHVIKAWTGGIGRQLLELTDYIGEKTGLIDTPASPWSSDWIKNLDSIPFVKAFVIRQPGSGSVHVAKLWQTFSQFKQIELTINRLKTTILDEDRLEKELNKIYATEEGQIYQFLTGNSEFPGPVPEIANIKKHINIIRNLPDNTVFSETAIEDIKSLYKYYEDIEETANAFLRKGYKIPEYISNRTLMLLIEDIVTNGTFVSDFLPSPNAKKEQLDYLYRGMIDLAKETNKAIRTMKEIIKEGKVEK